MKFCFRRKDIVFNMVILENGKYFLILECLMKQRLSLQLSEIEFSFCCERMRNEWAVKINFFKDHKSPLKLQQQNAFQGGH